MLKNFRKRIIFFWSDVQFHAISCLLAWDHLHPCNHFFGFVQGDTVIVTFCRWDYTLPYHHKRNFDDELRFFCKNITSVMMKNISGNKSSCFFKPYSYDRDWNQEEGEYSIRWWCEFVVFWTRKLDFLFPQKFHNFSTVGTQNT